MYSVNATELRTCMARLQATYQHETWTPELLALWAEKFAPLSAADGRATVEAMGEESKWLEASTFAKVRKGGDGGVISRNGCTFLPGTGWTPCHPDELEGPRRSEQVAELPELSAPPMSEEQYRKVVAETRRRIEQGRRAMTGDPEVAGKVDALAAALRMPEGQPDA